MLMAAVVCAGIKSVLDIPRTLEFLETQGVTVASYGAGQPTSELPYSWASCTNLPAAAAGFRSVPS